MKSRIAIILSGVVAVILYYIRLAPDYSIPGPNALAIASSWSSGILNPPGYPLFGIVTTILKLFPDGSSALKANLLACLLGGVSYFLYCLTIQNLMLLLKKSHLTHLDLFTLCLFAMGLFFSPLLVAQFSHLEKYSVSIPVLFLFFWVTTSFLKGPRESSLDLHKVYLTLGFTTSLAFLAHYTYAPLILTSLIYVIVKQRIVLRRQILGLFALGCVFGLTPLIYLPIVANRNPILNWGNSENLANFWNMLSRAQYRDFQIPLTWDYFKAQWELQYNLIANYTLLLPFIALAVVTALAINFHRLIKLKSWPMTKPPWIDAGCAILLLFLSGELVTAFVRFYNPLRGTPEITQGFNRMMWPFFTPWVLILGALSFILFLSLMSFGKKASLQWVACCTFLLVIISYISGPLKQEKHPNVLGEYRGNLKRSLSERTIILTSIDSIYFDLLTAQHDGAFPSEIPLVHLSLFQTSWYGKTLLQLYPQTFKPFESELERLSRAINDFEVSRNNNNLFEENKKLLLGIIKNQPNALLIEDSHLMPIDPMQLSPLIQEPVGIGAYLFEVHSEPHKVAWDQIVLSETLKGDVKDFPWLAGFRKMYEAKIRSRKPMEKILFPESSGHIDRFLSQLEWDR